MPSSNPLMYAELLSNIRQISVILALDTPCALSTQVELSPDGRRFILHHDGRASSLTLPGQVPCKLQLQHPALGTKELTWRLPLAGAPSQQSMDTMQGNCAPWAAKVLGPETEFTCRACSAVIVGRGRIAAWRDLPSENWAEMMDFWHCHKPDLPGGQVEESAVNKGFGANTRFTPTPGIGFVDLSTFLLADIDCQNTQTGSSSEEVPQHQNISCKVCHNFLGYIDQQSIGTRLYKWQLRSSQISQPLLRGIAPGLPTSPSLATIIAAQLAASMQSQGLSRFVLLPARWMPILRETTQEFPYLSYSRNGSFHGTPTSASTFSSVSMNLDGMDFTVDGTVGGDQLRGSYCSTCLNLWILNPSLRFSGNATLTDSTGGSLTSLLVNEYESGTPAMKVFWKTLTVEAAEKLAGSNSVEEMYLPFEAIYRIKSRLQLTSLFLPPSARKFQNWDVGLLERYEE
ncbi:HECT-like Ubiquitin-conjugating enzyme (E2)-binding domain containing protein [Hyaloscypha variabilis]